VRVADGEEFHARRVVVATGISNFAHRPPEFEHLPLMLASHSFDQDDLGRFARKSVVVVGAGQSALESAALLHEAGATVEVLVRRPATFMIPDVKVTGVMKAVRKALSPIARPPFDIMGPRFISWLIAWPRMYRHAPLSLQRFLTWKAVRPGGSGWLAPRLQSVAITTACHVVAATATPDGSRVRLKLSNGTERVVDHVLLATGYRVDVNRYPFLAPALREGIRTRNGYPALAAGFESSVPGLHFLGTPAADTFGPLCRFVAGTPYMARALTRFITSLNGERADRSEPVLNDALA
jgi:cation diffusion facilitator CzcD-associated flavoprotein CzcO